MLLNLLLNLTWADELKYVCFICAASEGQPDPTILENNDIVFGDGKEAQMAQSTMDKIQ